MIYGFEFSVEAVNNGFIVKVLKNGGGTLKEYYEGMGPVYVFKTLDEAIIFLKEIGSS